MMLKFIKNSFNLKFFQNNLILILNIIFGLVILPLLGVITFVNTENIYHFNFSDIYTVVYFIYLLIGILGISLFRFVKISNTIIKEEVLYMIKSILFISLLIVPSFFICHNFIVEHIGESNLYLRGYGKIAFLYFALALIITPILKFVKNPNIRDNFILSRKIFGILSFIFFLKHGLEYFALEYIYQSSGMTYLEYISKNLKDRYDAVTGIIAGILMLLLGITSNKVSVKIFGGKKWKLIQSLAYPCFLISIIHIAFSGRLDNFYIFLVVLVVSLRTFAYISGKSKKRKGKTTKYLCIPCGYIYDESKGDPDSGIEPGTKFEDIPDDWYCPVCGVGKADFEPYYEEENTVFGGYLGKVISYEMLTEDVLELSLELDKEVSVVKGQYAILKLKDFDGEFSRAYSIVGSKGKIITFGIKLKDIGRGGRMLKTVKKGDIVKINGIYGDFVLKDNNNPKVFVATGTGLSPIMNMVSGKLLSKDNHLFFGVQSKKDLFYIDKIKKLENMKAHIYLSREEVKGFNYGRIDLTKFKFAKNTEFYMCGSPGLINSTKQYLQKAGYKNVYSEKF